MKKYLYVPDIMADLDIKRRADAYQVMHSKGFPLEPSIKGCGKHLRVLASNYEAWKKKKGIGQEMAG